MARYRLTKDSFVDGVFRKEGEIVEYKGEPAAHMKPETDEKPPIPMGPPPPDYQYKKGAGEGPQSTIVTGKK